MKTEKQMQAYERDSSYVFLLFGALLCAIFLAMATGCNNSHENDLPLLAGMQNGEVVDPPDDPQPEPDPVADFQATPIQGATPLTVEFSDSSQGSIYSYSWQFGDGTESSMENPAHVYTEPGTYSVILKIRDAQMREFILERQAFIEVFDETLNAAFSSNVTSGVPELGVQFVDESEGNITQWLWDFGDGETSELQNPGHTYSEPGTYSVTLRVSGPGGEAEITEEGYILVAAPEVDLAAVSAQVDGYRFQAGAAMQIEALIQNLGPDNVTEINVKAYLSVDSFFSEEDLVIYQDSAEGIEAGNNRELTLPAFVPHSLAIGSYALLLEISAPDFAMEIDGSNNRLLVCPVTIYGIMKFAPCADTFVSCDKPYDSMGDMPALLTEYEDVNGTFSMIQMAFDLSEIENDPSVVVAAARLNMYAVSSAGGETECLEVYAIEEAWNEDSCNWDNGPFPEPEMWAISSVPAIGWTEIELTQLTQAWLEGSVRNNGVALYTWTDETAFTFFSKEHDDISYRPYLEIEIDPSTP